jgi:hypothetical protein
MLITRKELLQIGYFIKSIKEKGTNCEINTKYKLLKLERLLKDEFEITNMLLNELSLKYIELDEKGQPIVNEEGAMKIQSDKTFQLNKELAEFYTFKIQIPEFFFSLDEFEKTEVSWEELEALIPFIK